MGGRAAHGFAEATGLTLRQAQGEGSIRGAAAIWQQDGEWVAESHMGRAGWLLPLFNGALGRKEDAQHHGEKYGR